MSASSIREAATNLYGVEKDDYLAKLGRLHVSILSGGHPNVVCGDSLALTTEAGSRLEDSIPVSDYDVVLTNPPFGVNIVAASAEVLGGVRISATVESQKRPFAANFATTVPNSRPRCYS